MVNEFVGPAQFQFTDVQVAIANEVLGVLPDRWRMDSTTGRTKTEYVRQPRDYWKATTRRRRCGPTRSCRSSSGASRWCCAATTAGRSSTWFSSTSCTTSTRGDEKDVAAIRLLGLLEDLLIRHGVLESDFTLRVLRKGPRTGPPTTRRDLMPGVEIEALRSKAAVLQADNARLRGQIQRLEASRVWRLAQALRGLVGRRW